MIIVHFAEYASGGVATYLRNVISFQLDNSSVKKVILINSKKNSEKFTFRSKKFEQYTYTYNRNIFGIVKLLLMRKKIDSFNPDVVHFHSSFAGMVRLTYFFKKSKYKVVYCSHGWSFTQKNMGKFKEKIYEYVERLAAKKTSNIINISKYEEEEAIIHHLPKRKMKLIYNSISEYKRIFNIKNPFQNNKKKITFYR